MKTTLNFLILLVLLTSCGNNASTNNAYSYEEESDIEESGYADGRYCAEIDYYYSKTNTHSEYTLEVEIEDEQLVIIYWPNGGWLDDSHFYPPDISDGTAEFTSDQGVDYEVEIIGKEGDCSLSRHAQSERSFLSEAKKKICPQCGGKKYAYDNYCDDCTDEIENTCSRCGAYEYGVNGGLCSSCEEEEEENEDDW